MVSVGTVRSGDGTVIAYERGGSGPGVVVVDGALCHRGAGPARSIAGVLARDFDVITYDRRGRGGSTDTGPYAVEREVEDLAAVAALLGDDTYVYGISSGGLLAMQAAAHGVPFPRLAVFEPPLGDEGAPSETAELAALIAAGRHEEAVRTFLGGMGMPEEALAGMEAAIPGMVAIAPTMVYDATICDETTPDVLARVDAPTVVLDSGSTGQNLSGWAERTVGALPHGTHRSLPGEWHMVADEVMAAAIREFLLA